MKALTICQPYAELICCLVKRVENRTWPTKHRGQLLIHAGKSRQWLVVDREHGEEVDEPSGIHLSTMDFGALIATADLIDCIHADEIRSGSCDERYPWIRAHQHVHGPWCWVLDNVQRLDHPVPWKGSLGLFEVADAAFIKGKLEYVMRQQQTREHECHGGCGRQCKPAMWGCRECWSRLPMHFRNRIWQTYRPRQEIDGRPSPQYIAVAKEVQEYIAANWRKDVTVPRANVPYPDFCMQVEKCAGKTSCPRNPSCCE